MEKRSSAVLLEDQAGVADPDHIPMLQLLALDAVAVDRRSIGRAEVVGDRTSLGDVDIQVTARDTLVDQLQIGLRAAAHDVAARLQVKGARRAVDD